MRLTSHLAILLFHINQIGKLGRISGKEIRCSIIFIRKLIILTLNKNKCLV